MPGGVCPPASNLTPSPLSSWERGSQTIPVCVAAALTIIPKQDIHNMGQSGYRQRLIQAGSVVRIASAFWRSASVGASLAM